MAGRRARNDRGAQVSIESETLIPVARSRSSALRRPADPLASVLARQRKELWARLPAALGGQGEPLHQLRVACRRLRLTLALLVSTSNGRRVRRARRTLRRLGRAAGPTRDLGVALVVLEEHLRQAVSPPPAGPVLRRRLRAALTRSRSSMSAAVLELDLARLRRDLGATVSSLHLRREEVRPLIGARLRQEGEGLMAALGGLRGIDVDALHGLRRRVRRLRYLAELTEEVLDVSGSGASRFKELQERLGLIRDTWLAAHWLKEQAERARRRGEADVARDGARLARAFDGLVRQQHAAWCALPPAKIIGEALSATGPSLAGLTGPA